MNQSGARKSDQGKLEWHLLPEDALESILKVFQMGSAKYGDFNWLSEPTLKATRVHNSAQRHRSKWVRGQDYDEESGLPELAHICANYIMLLTYHLRGKMNDDRQKLLTARIQNDIVESTQLNQKKEQINGK